MRMFFLVNLCVVDFGRRKHGHRTALVCELVVIIWLLLPLSTSSTHLCAYLARYSHGACLTGMMLFSIVATYVVMWREVQVPLTFNSQ